MKHLKIYEYWNNSNNTLDTSVSYDDDDNDDNGDNDGGINDIVSIVKDYLYSNIDKSNHIFIGNKDNIIIRISSNGLKYTDIEISYTSANKTYSLKRKQRGVADRNIFLTKTEYDEIKEVFLEFNIAYNLKSNSQKRTDFLDEISPLRKKLKNYKI